MWSSTYVISVLAGLMVSGTALGQSLDPFVGTWTARWNSDSNEEFQGEILIQPEGSTWKRFAKSWKGSRNPCFGRALPAVTEVKSASEVEVKVVASEAAAGCDATLILNLVDPTHMEGKFGSGRPLKAEKR
jgi:hypothetical protein